MRADDKIAMGVESSRRGHDHYPILIAAAAALVAGSAAIVLSDVVEATVWRYLMVAGIIVGVALIAFAVYADRLDRRIRRDVLAERQRADEIGAKIMRLPDDGPSDRFRSDRASGSSRNH